MHIQGLVAQIWRIRTLNIIPESLLQFRLDFASLDRWVKPGLWRWSCQTKGSILGITISNDSRKPCRWIRNRLCSSSAPMLSNSNLTSRRDSFTFRPVASVLSVKRIQLLKPVKSWRKTKKIPMIVRSNTVNSFESQGTSLPKVHLRSKPPPRIVAPS